MVLFAMPLAAQDGELHDLVGQAHAPLGQAGSLDVLVFVCHDCPISARYAGEIQRISDAYAARHVRVFLVLEEEGFSADAARAWARDFALRCAVLSDDDRSLARLAHARVTPEAAVFTVGGVLAYHGRIDDGWIGLGKPRAQVGAHDLRAALDALLAGRAPDVAETTAVGCVITVPAPAGTAP